MEFEPHPSPQERTDGDVAIEYALQRGATSLIVLGALGGPRLDHAVGNLDLISSTTAAGYPDLGGGRLDGADGVAPGMGCRSATCMGGGGDYVSIVPISELISGVSTVGLKWGLEDAELPRGRAAGESNELLSERAMVRITSGIAMVGHHFVTERLP